MKITKFEDFRQLGESIYSAFRENSTMSNLRIWDSYPGDILRERSCWYLCVRLNEEAQMMITYDPNDDDPNPYVCWYDYGMGTITYPHWCYPDLEQAMIFCCHEPHRNYRSYKHDFYCLFRFGSFNHSWQAISSLSLLTIPDYVKNEPYIPAGIWDVRRFSSITPQAEGETIYQLRIDTDVKYEGPLSTIPRWGIEFFLSDYIKKQ